MPDIIVPMHINIDCNLQVLFLYICVQKESISNTRSFAIRCVGAQHIQVFFSLPFNILIKLFFFKSNYMIVAGMVLR